MTTETRNNSDHPAADKLARAAQYAARVRQYLPVSQEAAFRIWREQERDQRDAAFRIIQNWSGHAQA